MPFIETLEPRTLLTIPPLPAGTPPIVRVAYLIPSNRDPQPGGVANLQCAITTFQGWYRDQMQRSGFGPKTFLYETAADEVTPEVHVVEVQETDDYLRGDIWPRVNAAASAAGVPLFAQGQVWLLVPEIHTQTPDGDITGGVALGASNGSGRDGGVAQIGTNSLPFLNEASLRDTRAYHGLTVPEIGPYPLVQNVSYASFEGSTISQISSTYLGAMLHELTHAFGLPHDFRNDANFDGNLMGNGFRGFRGAVLPDRFPNDAAYLQHGQARMLNTSRYFNRGAAPESTGPTISSAAASLVNGSVRITFNASDSSGLASVLLLRNGEQVAEAPLTGSTAAGATISTPYYDAGVSQTFRIMVYDVHGNRRTQEISYTPPTAVNRAPKPFIDAGAVVAGTLENVTFTSSTSDPEGAPLTYEWDTDGDGIFDTPPMNTATLTVAYGSPGTRLLRLRATDPQGASAVSAPLSLKVFPLIRGSASSDAFYLRTDPADASMLQVFRGTEPSGNPSWSFAMTSDGPVTIDALAGNDRVILDFTFGNPLPMTASLRGGSGDDVVEITGTSPADSLAFAVAGAVIGPATISHDQVEQFIINSSAARGLVIDGPLRALLGLRGGVFRTGALALTPDARLDIADNDLIVSKGDLDAIHTLIRSARNANPPWSGPGITSTTARDNPLTGVAVDLAGEDVVVKHTWNGDANLDDRIDADDYFRIDSGFLNQPANPPYAQGNFNYDAVINADDYFLIDSAFLGQSPPAAMEIAAAAVTPTINSTSPSRPTATGFRQSFVINGSGFALDATVTLRDVTHDVSYPNRPVLSRSGASAISITPNFGSTAARWAVTVTNPGAPPTPEFQFDVILPNVIPQPGGIPFVASPHHGSRNGADIDTIVIHTVEGSYTSAINTFLNPNSRVSAHYVISPTGAITQMVPLDRAAWHATYYNSRSIGIEMAGFAAQASTWTPQNLAALVDLTAWLALQYDIPILRPTGDARDTANCRYASSGLVAHAQIQPGCDSSLGVRSDPGPHFPWSSYIRDVQDRLSAVARLLPDGTLSLNTTAATDTTEVRLAGSTFIVTRNGHGATFSSASVRRLRAISSSGADRLTLSGGSHIVSEPLPRLSLHLTGSTTVALLTSQDLASLAIASTATLDLATHDLVIRGNTPGLLASLAQSIRSARNAPAGRWRGPGITSSAARDNPLTGLGLFSGLPDAASTLIKYTWNGDATADGIVNADDYFRIDSAFLAPPAVPAFRDGDFNYDGTINADDYFLIDAAFLGQSSPLFQALPAPQY